jgi:hypothetical protein
MSEETALHHAVPEFYNKDIPEKMKWSPFELIYSRLGHCHCSTLVATKEHRLWKDKYSGHPVVVCY